MVNEIIESTLKKSMTLLETNIREQKNHSNNIISNIKEEKSK